MTEELQSLWLLRDLDERLATLHGALRRYPELRKSLEGRVGSERERLEGSKRHASELQLKRRQLEKDIEALSTEERKFQSQLPLVKKNEEYTALLHEIAGAKARRSDRETDLLVVMEAEEKLQNERPLLEKSVTATESEVSGRLRDIEAEEKEERDQLATLEGERRSLLERLPAGTRSRYERIHASREGRAVVPITKGACGGCFRGQPPQVLQAARRGDRLLTCDGCGRLMVWPPEAAPD